MSRYLPVDLEPEDPQPMRSPRARLPDARGWLVLGMGLAGILTVALIVTAGHSPAGIDGMRALRAIVPEYEQDPPDAVPSILAPATSASPSPVPSPSASPAPSNSVPPFIPTPSAAPRPTPSPTAAPTLAISSDRRAMAVVVFDDLVPGDSMDRTITIQNTGSLAFRYTVAASATASTVLWTDTSDGLQLTVETTGGALLYAGPLSGLTALPGPTVLAPGTTETLRYSFRFPTSAPNAFQGLLQDLTLVFDAVEFP